MQWAPFPPNTCLSLSFYYMHHIVSQPKTLIPTSTTLDLSNSQVCPSPF